MKSVLPLLAIFVLATVLSCTEEDRIVAVLVGDEEFGEEYSGPFALYQNYPNPFNPTTTIRFGVAAEMYLRLKVYSEDWQPIETLVDGTVPAGFHAVSFNAFELPSGIYFYTAEGGGITQIRAMRLSK